MEQSENRKRITAKVGRLPERLQKLYTDAQKNRAAAYEATRAVTPGRRPGISPEARLEIQPKVKARIAASVAEAKRRVDSAATS